MQSLYYTKRIIRGTIGFQGNEKAPGMEAGATSLKGMRIPMPEQVRHDVEQGDLANLDLQDAILAFSDVVALAEAVQLHLGLPSGHVIRGAHEVSVHIEQHNAAGAV